MEFIKKLLGYIIGYSFLIALFGFIFGNVYYALFLEPSREELFVRESYKGVVTETVFIRNGTNQIIYIQRLPHETINICVWEKLLTGKNIAFNKIDLSLLGIPDLYNYVQKGDTITKFTNSSEILIQNGKRSKVFVAKLSTELQK